MVGLRKINPRAWALGMKKNEHAVTIEDLIPGSGEFIDLTLNW